MRHSAALLAAIAVSCEAAPLLKVGPEVIPGEYFVVLHSNVAQTAHDKLTAQLGGKHFSIGNGAKAFRGIHAKLNTTQLSDALAHGEVRYVEPNQRCHAVQVIQCPDTQMEPLSWGQKRVTTTSAGDVLDVYAHSASWGEGTDAYILDTGIRITHEEFEGRAIWGANFAGGADTDNNGHGTHCAGTVGGKRYGVAKAATLIAVKVLGDSGSGSFDGIISGIQWSVNERKARGRPGVGSMSLGGGRSAAVNDAVNAAAADGMLFSNAGGNNNANACNFSPASAEDGMCVGSTELANSAGSQIDRRSSFSNFGECTHVFAPGSSIVAAYRGADNAYSTLSGTSMAAPHATAVALIALQQYPTLEPIALRDWIVKEATSDQISGPGAGSPNKMLHVDCNHVPAPETPAPPPTPAPPTPPPTPAPTLSQYYSRGPCDTTQEVAYNGICLPMCPWPLLKGGVEVRPTNECPPYGGNARPSCTLSINGVNVCKLDCTSDADCIDGATCGTIFNMCVY